MAYFAAVAFALAGWCVSEPPSLRSPNSIPVLPRVDPRERLEDTRRAITIVESCIKSLEEDLKELPNTLERTRKLRRDLDEMRGHLVFMKKDEQVLLWGEEQRKVNPGLKTEQEIADRLEKVTNEWDAWQTAWKHGHIAPMPREKK